LWQGDNHPSEGRQARYLIGSHTGPFISSNVAARFAWTEAPLQDRHGNDVNPVIQSEDVSRT
jgi:hypothetical protein